MATHEISIIPNILRVKSIIENKGQDCVDWSWFASCLDNLNEKK